MYIVVSYIVSIGVTNQRYEQLMLCLAGHGVCECECEYTVQ